MAHQCIFLNLREAAAIFQIYGTGTLMMLVSGVRRSWEIARSRFARIFSFSASISIFSRSASTRACVFMLLVMALVMLEIENIATKVIG